MASIFTRSVLCTGLVCVALGGVFVHSAVVAQNAVRNEPILPLPAVVTDVDPAKARLGGKLFADTRLSGDGSVSCQSCHLPTAGGADPRRHSVSAFGVVRELNSPTIYNVRYNTTGLNWTGRTESLEKQIAGSVGNKDTMAHDWAKVIAVLGGDAALQAEFKNAYGGDAPLNQANAMDAIVSFERSLVTPSRFDDYLRGADNALSAREKLGYETFKANGCTACHNGINVGGNAFFKLGLTGDYFADRVKRGKGAPVELDKGRVLFTKNPADLHVFRVAPLRNVALTAPYFHDGSVDTLEEAIVLMGRYQLGREIDAKDTALIASFLGSLTGKEFEKKK